MPPSNRTAGSQVPSSSSGISPGDSSSNAPDQPIASQKINGSSRNTTERRTESVRSQVTTRERLHMRQGSPVKITALDGHGSDGQHSRLLDHRRRSSPSSASAAPSRKEKIARPPWEPQASLTPQTSAPLASRISVPPLASLLPQPLEPPPLSQLSPQAQEAAILDDLLYTLMGFEGQYIRYVDSYNPSVEKDRLAGPNFRILPGLDPSLRDLTTSVLKMATYHSAIEAFVEVQSRAEFGSINHALCASIRKLLKDYLILVTQLENRLITSETFSLHVLHLHTLPTNQMMFQVYNLAQEILKKNALVDDDLDDTIDDFDDVDNILEQLREGGELAPGGMSKANRCTGGSVLRLLTERLSRMSGDPAARALLQTLLRDASRPYMTMLNEWVHRGGIKDPHNEFLIKEQKSIGRENLDIDYTDEYWEKRYTIREPEVPPQLGAVKQKVLLAGKYLNVVRECGGVDISTEVHDVPKSFDDPRFLDNINAAYAHANSSLLDLLLTTHALSARLISMKHYFFLDQSDFFTYFLDLSASELKKKSKDVNVGKLQSLLDLVVRQPGSIAAQDPFKEEVKVQMNPTRLAKFLVTVVSVRGFEEDELNDNASSINYTPSVAEEINNNAMTGYESLEFKFSIPFPLSLVISSKTVLRYQILFRYLLSMRYTETVLVNAWEDQNKLIGWTHRSKDRNVEMFKRRVWTLRSRMLVFCKHFSYYCTAEVMEPNWRRFMARVDSLNNPEAGAAQEAGPKKVGRTVDELMDDHVDFLDTCMKECMLLNVRLLRVYTKILSTCTLFAKWMPRLNQDLILADLSLVNTPAANRYLALHLAHYPHHHPSANPATTSSSSTAPMAPQLSKPAPPPSQKNKQPPSSTTNKHAHPQSHRPTQTPTPAPTSPLPPELTTHDPTKYPSIDDMLTRYENNFNHHLKIICDALDYYAATETVALGRLCALLSFAGEKAG
ncbi:MAG: hypothetical protein Q9228_003621, partial [Teloschistes exilis]